MEKPLHLNGTSSPEADVPQQVNSRDMEVLRVIEEEKLASFTFEGLKRRINTHSETLSRILYRLEEQEILEKANEGYRVTEKGKELLGVHPLNSEEPRLMLLRTLLPPEMDMHRVFLDLKGRWFGTLRWLGYSKKGNEFVLKWITDDGGIQVDATFSPNALTVEGKLLEGKDLADAIRASHQLVGYVARLYSKPRMRQVAYFRTIRKEALALLP
ncbi:MAG: hypothetical protein HYU03_01085 [Thaumarchaeota archaeon]|nr:hypothetical protein [Nitrososphaerota archaeon]